MIYGTGSYRYEEVKNWAAAVKSRWNVKECAGITVDREDRIYLLTRTVPPVILLDSDGTILASFGGDVFVRAHGMFRSSKDIVYGVDDGGHAVYAFDSQYRVTQVWGTRGVPSDTGCINKDYKTIRRSAGPFNFPTRIAEDTDGFLYVSDGYGNARVHKFSPDGELIQSWGEPGSGPGQFNLPHGIAVSKDNIVYVADRQNHRIQLFTTNGKLLDIWDGFHRPSDIWIDKQGVLFIAECKRSSDFFSDAPSRVSICSPDGHLLSRLEDESSIYDPDKGSHCAHGLCVDSEGSLYITEVGKQLSDIFLGIRKYRRL